MRTAAITIVALAVASCTPPPQRDQQGSGEKGPGTTEIPRAPADQGLKARLESPPRLAAPPVQKDAIPAPPDVAAPPEDALKTDSGLAYKVLEPGTGATHPTLQSVVRVHYTGWTTDGRMFDSSVLKGKPAEFPLNKVILGWQEGVQLMVPGQTTRFWIPVELAYNHRPDRPDGMLVFDVQLIDILD
jgi:peptidylprolyl isomerase